MLLLVLHIVICRIHHSLTDSFVIMGLLLQLYHTCGSLVPLTDHCSQIDLVCHTVNLQQYIVEPTLFLLPKALLQPPLDLLSTNYTTCSHF